MELAFLGTGGYHYTKRGMLQPCILFPELRIFLDAGAGFAHANTWLKHFKEEGKNDLHFLLTHSHQDHSVGLTYWWDMFYPFFNQDNGRYEVDHHLYCGAETLDTLDTHLLIPKLGGTPRKDWPFNHQAHTLTQNEETFEINGATIHAKKFRQRETEVYIYSVEYNGKKVSYVTDINTIKHFDEVVAFVKESDALIIDTYFDSEYYWLAEKTAHGYTSASANIAKSANVGTLFLTHINPYRTNLQIYINEITRTFSNVIIPNDTEIHVLD
jgi:ribonuclease BN (tRNA processing enzyme)